jgi:hypothetical protein
MVSTYMIFLHILLIDICLVLYEQRHNMFTVLGAGNERVLQQLRSVRPMLRLLYQARCYEVIKLIRVSEGKI